MKKVHWFNPENDLALASGTANYTAPRPAASLRRAGAWLPSLWADPADEILDIDIPAPSATTRLSACRPEPWGWSHYTRRVLLRRGVAPELMPTAEELETMRRLSHRRSASAMLEHLGWPAEFIPVEARTADEALRAIEARGGDAVVKLPWSCSGRGVSEVRRHTPSQLTSMLEGMILRQGSVMIEPRYERKADFAALFHVAEGRVEFRGMSAFATDPAGHYQGNIVAPQPAIMRRIPAAVETLIEPLRAALTAVFAAGYRNGWIGVDMLSYVDTADGSEHVMPCIEVNMRMTMGVAALLAAESGRLPWREALLRVALPGETLPPETITLADFTPPRGLPLAAPVVTVATATKP